MTTTRSSGSSRIPTTSPFAAAAAVAAIALLLGAPQDLVQRPAEHEREIVGHPEPRGCGRGAGGRRHVKNVRARLVYGKEAADQAARV